MEEKSLNVLDKIVLLYFVIQVFFIRWFNGKSYISYIGILLFFIMILRKKHIFKLKITDLIVCYMFVSIVCINIAGNGIQPLLVRNLYTQGIADFFVIAYILILVYENREGLGRFIRNDLFYIFNIYFLINIPILLKQIGNTFFLMRNFEENPFYQDHITGLIGANGTHELTFYWIMLILINMYRYSVKKEKALLVVNVIYVIFMIIISSQNDNTAFFIIFPLIISQYFLKDIFNKKKLLCNIVKLAVFFIVFMTMGGILYYENKNVNEFVNSRVIEKLHQYGIINDEAEKNEQDWSDDEERISLYKYAIKDGNGYGIGKGIGSIESYGDPSMPDHFGMSEISSRTYEGGIVYLCGYIVMFSYFLYRVFRINENTPKILSLLIIIFDIVLFSIYTLIFRLPFFAFALVFITLIFSSHYNNYNLSKN